MGSRVPPDLVVEVSSPSTRQIDAGAKRDLYERIAVPEYWLADPADEEIAVHRLDLVAGAYPPPTRLRRGAVLDCSAAPGFRLPVARLLDA